MAGEYWLVIAATCLGYLAWRGPGWVRRLRYEPHHTAEQPRVVVEHEGATEEWSPRRAVETAPPSPPVDPRILLREAKERRVHLDREIAELEARVEADEADRLHQSLERLERHFREQLSRTGRAVHLEADTAEWRRSDIRRIVRSGAPAR